jgi:hypothetical protein
MTYKAVDSGGSQPTLQRIIRCTCYLLHAYLLLGLTLDPYDGAVCCFETSLDVHRTTGRYIQENRTLHNHRCGSLDFGFINIINTIKPINLLYCHKIDCDYRRASVWCFDLWDSLIQRVTTLYNSPLHTHTHTHTHTLVSTVIA